MSIVVFVDSSIALAFFNKFLIYFSSAAIFLPAAFKLIPSLAARSCFLLSLTDCEALSRGTPVACEALLKPGSVSFPTFLVGVLTTFLPFGIVVRISSANLPLEGFTPLGFGFPLIFVTLPVFSSWKDSFFATRTDECNL